MGLNKGEEMSEQIPNPTITFLWWVGVLKGSYCNHDVFTDAEENCTPQKYPQFDYVIGPYTSKAAAEERARNEKNKTGTFTDPFCNGGEGR